MELSLPKTLDRAATLRYLGAANWTPDENTETLLQAAERELRAACTPRGIWRELPADLPWLHNGGSDLARHLMGCDGVVLMAVTLGSGADALLRRLCLRDIALGAVADAAASVLMEDLCDELEAQIRTQQQKQGRYMTGRYSPGYGDCPLAMQDELCLALDTVRGIGLCVTKEHLMTPRKSVTAILGTAGHPVAGARAGCAHCVLRETCAYRKRGTTCETG